ncbi:MAG: hypothetical protein OXG41_08040 [Acidimicrobiaceae bacterium]|nr:hypothetical protein [Acidimicrobiaceae bacterium]
MSRADRLAAQLAADPGAIAGHPMNVVMGDAAPLRAVVVVEPDGEMVALSPAGDRLPADELQSILRFIGYDDEMIEAFRAARAESGQPFGFWSENYP